MGHPTTEPSQILDYLFLGSKSHARDRDLLRRLNISHILNVTPPKKVDPVAGVPNYFEKEFEYRRCALFDNKGEDILTSIEGCISFIEIGKHYGGVFVHCKKGISRSSSIIIAYLMKINEMSFQQALEFVKARRPQVNPNDGFVRQLQLYGERLQRNKAAKTTRKTEMIGPCLPPGILGSSNPDNGIQGSDDGRLASSSEMENEKKTSKALNTIIGPSLSLPENNQRTKTIAKTEMIGPCLPPGILLSNGPDKEMIGPSLSLPETNQARTSTELQNVLESTNSLKRKPLVGPTTSFQRKDTVPSAIIECNMTPLQENQKDSLRDNPDEICDAKKRKWN